MTGLGLVLELQADAMSESVSVLSLLRKARALSEFSRPRERYGKMNVPKITVILPTYNVESYIAETLDSLINQLVPLYEIIVVNDGSTDGTLTLLESNYAKRQELKIITQDNQGVGASRRNGPVLATGDYFFFCDPDDAASVQRLELSLTEGVQ